MRVIFIVIDHCALASDNLLNYHVYEHRLFHKKSMINDQQGQHILQQFLCYHIKSNTFRDLFIPIIQHQSFRVKSTKAVEGFKGKKYV